MKFNHGRKNLIDPTQTHKKEDDDDERMEKFKFLPLQMLDFTILSRKMPVWPICQRKDKKVDMSVIFY
jgi:hypothetical protein